MKQIFSKIFIITSLTIAFQSTLSLAMESGNEKSGNQSEIMLRQFYQLHLNREPDSNGLDYYLGQVRHARSLEDIAFEIAHSKEAQIRTFYRSFLNREPDMEGFKHYLLQAHRGRSLEEIRLELAGSNEALAVNSAIEAAMKEAICKNAFLNTSRIMKQGSRLRFSVNAEVGLDGQFNIPVVHTYHLVGAAVPLAVRFPEAFKSNLPNSIRTQLSNHRIEDVDIYFAPQLEVHAPDASLKPAYWMYPNRPKVVEGGPAEYNQPILMGLFELAQPLDAEVRSGELRPFMAILHDGLVSPDTGHLNMREPPAASFAFYSLAIFENQKRAAVTLHWMLTRQDKEGLEKLLVWNQNKTLMELLNSMNLSGWLENPNLMQKLNELTK